MDNEKTIDAVDPYDEDIEETKPEHTYEDSKEIDTKGNKKSTLWLISIFSATGQFFFGNFFSAFAAEAGASGGLLGFMTSIRNLLSSILQGNIGFLSDKIGRKMIMLFGIILNFAITIPLIFFDEIWLLIVVAIIQAFSLSIFIPAWNAVLGDVTKPEYRATFIGKISSIGRLVSVSFSIIIAVIFAIYGSKVGDYIILFDKSIEFWKIEYGVAFGIAAFNSLICAILIFTMKETRIEDKEAKRPRMHLAFKDRSFMKFVIVYSLFGLSMSFIWPLNPIIQVNVLNMEFYQIAVITSVFTMVMSITQLFAGRLGDIIGRRPIFLVGGFVLVLYPISQLPSIITGNWLWQILGNSIAGFGAGAFFVALGALTLDLAPEDLMGAYSGIREMFFGIAAFIGSLSAGFLVDFLTKHFGLDNTAIYMCIGISILRVLTVIGFFFVAESLPKEKRVNNHRTKIGK